MFDWGASYAENIDMNFMFQTLDEWSERCNEFVNLLNGQVDGYKIKIIFIYSFNVSVQINS